ncbi:MAG: secondary thiamine-phosphate synthase enzyme YjbQ [Chloroflexi bacterium]|nr:secondary thiamine-phosphate synthase enzyme YjbQ [Chloroflexota bacterium]
MVKGKALQLNSRGNCDIIDITSSVAQVVADSGINSGTVTIFISGSTAGLTTVEYEPGLVKDLRDLFDRIVPQELNYSHNARWGDGNGHAHVRASLLGASLVIPFTNKILGLGTWQQIVFIDFDNRPRTRNILIQIMGE